MTKPSHPYLICYEKLRDTAIEVPVKMELNSPLKFAKVSATSPHAGINAPAHSSEKRAILLVANFLSGRKCLLQWI